MTKHKTEDYKISAVKYYLNNANLIYCVDNSNKEANKFRYSQDQRRKETKEKKYSKFN